MKTFLLSAIAALIWFSSPVAHAQTDDATAQKSTNTRFPVYAEIGLGFGQTLFFGRMKEKLMQSYGGSFDPGTGNNLMMGFYIAPENWKGLGVGSRIKGTFGTSVEGTNGDSYIFNYYNLAVSAKYYGFSREFNKGWYGRASFGFGQFTTKRVNEAVNVYKHQYAIGTSTMLGIGYTLRFAKIAWSFEAEFDYSNRSGTIDGQGDTTFQSGQIGGNLILSF